MRAALGPRQDRLPARVVFAAHPASVLRSMALDGRDDRRALTRPDTASRRGGAPGPAPVGKPSELVGGNAGLRATLRKRKACGG